MGRNNCSPEPFATLNLDNFEHPTLSQEDMGKITRLAQTLESDNVKLAEQLLSPHFSGSDAALFIDGLIVPVDTCTVKPIKVEMCNLREMSHYEVQLIVDKRTKLYTKHYSGLWQGKSFTGTAILYNRDIYHGTAFEYMSHEFEAETMEVKFKAFLKNNT